MIGDSFSSSEFSPAKDRRRLAALMFTDVVGFSRIFHRDESIAMRLLEEKNTIVRSIYPLYGGREIKALGDGFFIEFASTLEAVKCAYEIQSNLFQWNLGLGADNRFQIRIGIHLCDFIDTGIDAFGDDVNISSRIEKLAPPGGICVSQQVVDQVRGKIPLGFKLMKATKLKNIARSIPIFEVELPWKTTKEEKVSWKSFYKRRISSLDISWVQVGEWFVRLGVGGGIINLIFQTTQMRNVAHPIVIDQSTVYFALLTLTGAIAAGSLFSWLTEVSDKKRFYATSFLLLNLLACLFYTPSVAAALNFQWRGVLNLVPLGLANFLLISTFYAMRKNDRVELMNNIIAIFFSIVGIAVLIRPDQSLDDYQRNARIFLAVSTFYSLTMLAFIIHSVWKLRKAEVELFYYTVFIGVFAIVDIALSTVEMRYNIFLSAGMDEFPMYQAVITTYLSLVLLVSIIAVIIDYTEKSRQSIFSKKAGITFTEASSALASVKDFDGKLQTIQKNLCEFLHASTSTIYLTSYQQSPNRLKLHAYVGPINKRLLVKDVIDPTVGIIGYVWKNKNPILVKDVGTDIRFADYIKARKTEDYSTACCIVVPLIYAGEVLGIISFADKKNGVPFSTEEFQFIQYIAKDLALLTSNQRFQESLSSYVNDEFARVRSVS